ncbi:MAG: hypothetical protein A3K19_19320 [Lentisphaerae bacterium RIFOXYB12_FULL_65_16]|nr:MAG: hypothetical protein A3K18_01150 [Lentisphaerae bacterium RIFOXYA12_64_32]OGV84638.1 MAG: hypothetical protein A3K19_19320 [Lentisphaerae bacterium RIFOXYB12_FULL_65_16]
MAREMSSHESNSTGGVTQGCPGRAADKFVLAVAPMAGITHSAFRRLLTELGGCDQIYTEMLAGTALLGERPDSPYLKRHPGDGKVIYQLLLRDANRIEPIVDRLRSCLPDGLDLNCACPAARVRRVGGGSDLFDDAPRLEAVLRELRRVWTGPLSVKVRLGRDSSDGWREAFLDRLRLIRDCGVNSLSINLRFAADRLTRPARHELLPWVCAEAGVPVTANGDITGPETVAAHPERFAACAGLMLGRMAVVRPWVFAAWRGGGADYAAPDLAGVWRRLVTLVREDFEPEKAFRPIRLFTCWYSRNFAFGNTLFGRVCYAPDLETLLARTEAFLAKNPAVADNPSMRDF